ncbi:MAG: exodeoxyribonuclease VII large subunit [Candidatus Protistobacter heckmanni]|nr:exodeoxyribonuclease VII large subunit [Candidatus Protistobacter heckmanni]
MNTDPAPSNPVAARGALTVGQLTRAIAELLERGFPLVRVRGEVSNFTRAASGHWYFFLKDAQAQIRCVMFRGRNQHVGFTPREGEAVEISALVSLYEPRGDLQLNVDSLRRAGQGDLFEAFLRLKEKLSALGWFDAGRKRPIPAHPRAIGVVTSLQAAALRDVLAALARRAPHVRVVVYPAPVQGKDAAPRLAAQIALANARAEVDVILLCRGGGSIEDLWAFNEEVLAHAVVNSAIPVGSGVGHETDFTIADFVADLRAPTPTAAAELASPDRERLLQHLERERQLLARALRRHLDGAAQRLDAASRRLVHPRERVAQQRTLLAQAGLRLEHALRAPLARATAELEQARWRLHAARPRPGELRTQLGYGARRLAAAQHSALQQACGRLEKGAAGLELLSPQRTLERGYAVLLTENGQALRSPRQLHPEQHLQLRLAEGAAGITLADVQTGLDGF